MAKSWRRILVFGLAFLLAVAGTFVFGYRVGRHARHLRWQTEPIRAWMSVPFIAHTHHVPAQVLFRAIGLPPDQRDRRPLYRIARDVNRPVGVLIRDLERAATNPERPYPQRNGPVVKEP